MQLSNKPMKAYSMSRPTKQIKTTMKRIDEDVEQLDFSFAAGGGLHWQDGLKNCWQYLLEWKLHIPPTLQACNFTAGCTYKRNWCACLSGVTHKNVYSSFIHHSQRVCKQPTHPCTVEGVSTFLYIHAMAYNTPMEKNEQLVCALPGVNLPWRSWKVEELKVQEIFLFRVKTWAWVYSSFGYLHDLEQTA